MMVKKVVCFVLIAECLSGCVTNRGFLNKHSKPEYMKAKDIAPAQMPSDLSSSNIQTYYPIPPVMVAQNDAIQPSVLPPGSILAQAQILQQQKTIASNQAKPHKSAVIASSKDTLVLNLSSGPAAWAAVGKALRAGGYKIAQQDSNLGIYYVLGVNKGDKLQLNTPIYQVNVKIVNNMARVTIYDEKNRVVNSPVSVRMLETLKQNL